MNAAVRTIVRVGIDAGMKIYGVRHGFTGLIDDNIKPLGVRDVSGLIQRGGTFLGTARSIEFKKVLAQQKCLDNLKARGIEGLIVIGGNGSQKGSNALSNLGFPVVGVASTVDNDLFGSDISIGSDTALNTIIDSIDKIKTTAKSHHRAFLIEVMGREYGYLALMASIAGGAEIVVTPEFEMSSEAIAEELRQAYKKGKQFALVVVTDGVKNNAQAIAAYFKKYEHKIGYELRLTILGHVQRGGSPSVFDRLLATRLGAAAIEMLKRGDHGKLIGSIDGKIAFTPLIEVVSHKKTLDPYMLNLAEILSK